VTQTRPTATTARAAIAALYRPRPRTDRPSRDGIDLRIALGTWLIAWVTAAVLGSAVLTATGQVDAVTPTLPVLAATMLLGWAVYLAGMRIVSRSWGTSRFATDYGFDLRPVDVLGFPVGVLCQIALVPAVYVPLQALWPAIFSEDRLSDNANQLVDPISHPAEAGLLSLLIVIGAPLVEELVYRGLLQRSFVRQLGAVGGWLAAAGLFTLIHFRPVEYPGLAAFSLVVGAVALRAGRLGPAIAVHIGFNATGLILAFPT